MNASFALISIQGFRRGGNMGEHDQFIRDYNMLMMVNQAGQIRRTGER